MSSISKFLVFFGIKRDVPIVTLGVFFRALAGLIFAKMAAASLGVYEYATYGHFYMLATYVVTASSLGLGSAFSVYVSRTRKQYGEQYDDGSLIVLASLCCGFIVGFIIIGLLLLDTRGGILPQITKWNLVWWFTFCIISSVGTSIQSILLGRQNHITYQIATILNPILSCIVLGAAMLLGSISPSVVIYTYMIGFAVPLCFIFPSVSESLSITRSSIRRLKEFSLPYIVPSMLIPTLGTFATLYVRYLIEIKVSVSDLGLWQGLWRLSEGYMGAIISIGSALFIPRFSRITTQRESKYWLRRAILCLLGLYAPLALVFLVIPKTIIRILLSSQFAGVSAFLPMEILGDILKICFFILQLFLTCMLLPRLALAGEVLFSLAFIVFTSLIESWMHSPEGAVAAYSLSYLLVVTLLLPLIFRQIRRLPPG